MQKMRKSLRPLQYRLVFFKLFYYHKKYCVFMTCHLKIKQECVCKHQLETLNFFVMKIGGWKHMQKIKTYISYNFRG